MFSIHAFQLWDISFQVSRTTIYFIDNPKRGTNKVKDSDYLSLLFTCVVEMIAQALSIIGMQKRVTRTCGYGH